MDREDSDRLGALQHGTAHYVCRQPPVRVFELLKRRGIVDRRDSIVVVEYNSFSTHSLFTETPGAEMGLLLDSAHEVSARHATVNLLELLSIWEIEALRHCSFAALSGGQRKFVLVAAQFASCAAGDWVVAVNIQQQLDAGRFRLLEENLERRAVSSVLWVEENTRLLKRKSNRPADEIDLEVWLGLASSMAQVRNE